MGLVFSRMVHIEEVKVLENPAKTKLNFGDLISKICSYGSKIFVVILFLLLFIGRINPGRISEVIGKNVSLIKSAVYFKSLSEDIVSLDKSAVAAADGESDAGGFDFFDFENMTDEEYFAAIAAMANAEASYVADDSDYEEEDDDDDYVDDKTLKGVKVKVHSYKKMWTAFKENHTEIASALRMDYIACVITCVAVLVCIVGFYLSFASGVLGFTGYGLICGGAVLTMLSMLGFNPAYQKLNSAIDMLDVRAMSPKFIPLYVVVCVIMAAFAVGKIVLALRARKSGVAQNAVYADVVGDEAQTSGSAVAKIGKTSIPLSPFQVTYRILSLLAFLLLFIPGANPARISAKISRNMSMFTSGFFYNIFTNNLQLIFRRGWVPPSIFRLASVSALLTNIGIIVCGAGSCMSVGNKKLKLYGHFCLIPGSILMFVSQFGILRAYNQLVSFGNTDRTQPLEPSGIIIFASIAVVIFAFSLISFIFSPKPEADEKCSIEPKFQLVLMIMPFLLLVFVFSYLPLWGWRYAFFDYDAGGTLSMDNWVGWKWFAAPFTNPATRSDILRVLRNTLAMSGLGILTSWCPMIFAVFLSEIRNTASRRIIQTLTTIPNFISWVLVYAIAFCIFGTEGFINNLFVKTLHFSDQGKNYLMDGNHIWIKMLLWGMWKGLGWSAIMYIAAISGIDQQLYEAATVDGAGRFQKMWHITLPELIPTYIVLLILSISNILSNGMDQYLMFKNPNTKGSVEVLDLYVYQITLGTGGSGNNIPFSTVVSMFKSVVSVILLFITNRISKIVRGSSIF